MKSRSKGSSNDRHKGTPEPLWALQVGPRRVLQVGFGGGGGGGGGRSELPELAAPLQVEGPLKELVVAQANIRLQDAPLGLLDCETLRR